MTIFSAKSEKVKPIETKYRKINGLIPCPGTQEKLYKLSKLESSSMHGQLPILWNSAIDCFVRDDANNQWIDFTSTIFVTNVGHANPRVKTAIQEVLDKNLMHSYNYASDIRINYLDNLIRFAGADNFEKAFLLSSGTEATECALKLMRLNAKKIGKRKRGIICISGNWHGRTMGAQLLSDSSHQKEWIGFQDPHIYYIAFPYPWLVNEDNAQAFFRKEIENIVNHYKLDLYQDIAGVMLETFQGWGAIFYPQNFVQSLREYCDNYNWILSFDEMQAGFSRTGKNFGYQHYNVKADIICCGKGMGSGIPLSGVIGSKELMDLPAIGSMSSTHSANPLVCAAGLATIQEIENKNLSAESYRKGQLLLLWLNELRKDFPDQIAFTLGKGLIASIIFKDSLIKAHQFAMKIALKCMQKGLLVVHTGRESIKIGPPLTISEDILKEGIEVIRESMIEVSAS